MMRYTPALLLSFGFWLFIGIYELSRGKPIQPFELIGGWLFWTLLLSLPFNALANTIRRRLHWPPFTILFLTPAIFLPIVLLWFILATSSMSRHVPIGEILLRSFILYLGTLPLSLSLLVTYRSPSP